MAKKKWPPPGFPLVEGDYRLTDEWSINLPEQYARRIEDGSLVLWRPGMTLWLAVFGNDDNESQAKRLTLLKRGISPNRFDERKSKRGRVTRYGYRLLDENDDGPVESVNALVISDDGHLLISVYFDDQADEEKAWWLVEGVKLKS